MLNFAHDNNGSPALDVLLESYPWPEVSEYVAQRHNRILARLPDSDQFRGIYWNESRVDVTPDNLGSDPAQAASRFREFLNSPAASGSDAGTGSASTVAVDAAERVGRADLLAEVAWLLEGASEGELDEPLASGPPRHERITNLRQAAGPVHRITRRCVHLIGIRDRLRAARGEGSMSYEQPPDQRAGAPRRPPPGWYPDPAGLQALRWWDGTQWGAHTRPLPGIGHVPQLPYPDATTAASEEYGGFRQQSIGRHRQQGGPQDLGSASDPYCASSPPAEPQQPDAYQPQGLSMSFPLPPGKSPGSTRRLTGLRHRRDGLRRRGGHLIRPGPHRREAGSCGLRIRTLLALFQVRA